MNNAIKIGVPAAPVGSNLAFPHENEDTVLVVIDMQPGFKAAHDCRTQECVEQEILRARNLGLAIVVVEFDPGDEGATFERFTALLSGYSRGVVVTKDKDDGSAEVFEACMDNGFWPESFRVCGVNSDACVLATVEGLLKRVRSCEITVVKDACNCPTGKDNDVWEDDYPSLRRCHVLGDGKLPVAA